MRQGVLPSPQSLTLQEAVRVLRSLKVDPTSLMPDTGIVPVDFKRLSIEHVNNLKLLTSQEFDQLPNPTKAYVQGSAHWERQSDAGYWKNKLHD